MLLCSSVSVCRIFANKGDVWRLMNSLSDVVDGRTWPENQESEVGAKLLQALGCWPYPFLYIYSVRYDNCVNSGYDFWL